MMSTLNVYKAGLLALALGLGAVPSTYAEQISTPRAAQPAVLDSYQNVLPLEGGSNFRDMGGYKTADGKRIRRGLLFRSGAMANLSDADQRYLDKFGFSSVVDLRSQEELELFPNRWATNNSDIEYINEEYRIANLAGSVENSNAELPRMEQVYRHFPELLQPQLKSYFAELLEGDAPLVVNCSAGQDRTGFASAMLLSALGVPRDVILQDYLLSTQHRRPANEMGNVDLKEAAKTNAFAKMMLPYTTAESKGPKPLYTEDKTPYLTFAFAEIEEQYGSVEAYLQQVAGVDSDDIAQLKRLYLEK